MFFMRKGNLNIVSLIIFDLNILPCATCVRHRVWQPEAIFLTHTHTHFVGMCAACDGLFLKRNRTHNQTTRIYTAMCPHYARHSGLTNQPNQQQSIYSCLSLNIICRFSHLKRRCCLSNLTIDVVMCALQRPATSI